MDYLDQEGHSMMRTSGMILGVVFLALGSAASAQFLGQMSPASTIANGSGKMGGYVVLHDDATAFVGSLRYGFSDDVEGRFRLGLIDFDGPNNDPHIILGGDFKFRLWKYRQNNNPFDFSLGAGLEYSVADHSNIFGLGGSVIGSIPFRLSNSSTLEPYARINLRYQRQAWDSFYIDRTYFVSHSHSDLKASLNLGTLFEVARGVDLTAELQIDNNFAFMVGVDFQTF
jgi:hypothetical protein